MASNQPHCSHVRERRSSKGEPLDFSQPTREITPPSTLVHDIGDELDDFAKLQRHLNEKDLKPQSYRKAANFALVVAGALGLGAYFSGDTLVAVGAATGGAIGVFLHFSPTHIICPILTRKVSEMLTSVMPRLEKMEEHILELRDVETDPVEKRTLDDVLLNLSEVKSRGDQLRAGHSSFSELQEMLRKVLHFGTMLQRTVEKYQNDWLLPGDERQ